MGFHKNFSAGGTDTSDATAKQWDIKNGLTAYIASGKVTGSGYFPAGMVFDGTSGFYSASYTSSGNKITVVARFKIASFTGDVVKFLCEIYGTSVANTRARIAMASSNHSTLTGRRSKLFVLTENSSNTAISFIVTSSTFDDDEWHTLFYEFDGDAGTAVLRIDGADEIDVANGEYVAATTGTLDSGASSTALVGSLTAAGSSYWSGDIGFFGYRDVGGLSWSDFMQTDGSPKQLDESTWTEWGAQPLFWHESGKMDENLGSAGAMTANGTITLAAASSWS